MRIFLKLSIILIVFFNNINSWADDKIISQLFSLMKQKRWAESAKLAKEINNPAITKIFLSQSYQDSKNNSNDFAKITKFIKENPNWPQNHLLRINAENSISQKDSEKLLFDWFSKNQPVTTKGWYYYSLAAAKFLEKQPKKLANIVKSAWQIGEFNREQEKLFVKKFGQYLNMHDHMRKIDNYLWQNKISQAKKYFVYLDKNYKKSFNAQIALLKKQKNAVTLFRQVPKEYYSSGLIYRYLQSRKEDLPKAWEIANLAILAAKDPVRASNFWSLQAYFAREFIAKRQYLEAYKVANSVFTTIPAKRSEAEYLAGWLALEYLKKPNLALKHFQDFNRIVKTPMSKARGVYWLARTYVALGQQEKANRLYQMAKQRYPYNFYGQVAAIELGQQHLLLPNKLNAPAVKPTLQKKQFKHNQLFQACCLTCRYGSSQQARLYINATISQAKSEEEAISLLDNLSSYKNDHHIGWAAKKALQNHLFIKKYAFPNSYQLEKLPIEPALTYSIIRQESVFDQQAVSSANARGLMQLISATACQTARLIGQECRISKLTSDLNYNISLGSTYLAELIKNFDGSYILAIASYNAGPHRIEKWLNIFGDPRKLRHHQDVINWLEHIPYAETRNYVQRVLENLQIYRSILNKSDKLYLLNDLLNKKSKFT